MNTSLIVTFVAAALTGGLAGTVITTYASVGRDNREARAKVRECLAEAEDLRWADNDIADFRKALSRLESAAILARFDRALISRYSYLAMVSRYQEPREQATFPGLPPRSLPLDFHMLLTLVLENAADVAWQSRLRSRRRKQRIWHLDQVFASMREEHSDWAWDLPTTAPRFMTQEPGIKAAVRRGLKQLVEGTPVNELPEQSS